LTAPQVFSISQQSAKKFRLDNISAWTACVLLERFLGARLSHDASILPFASDWNFLLLLAATSLRIASKWHQRYDLHSC
jgi:hypothetical protein